MLLNPIPLPKYHHQRLLIFFFIYNSETSNFPHFRWETSIKTDSQRAHASVKHGKMQCKITNQKIEMEIS